MRQIVLVAVLLAVACSAAFQTSRVEGERTILKAVSKQPGTGKAAIAVDSGSGTPTDPPFSQPKEFVFLGSNFCKNAFTLTPGSVSLYSGTWVSPPSPTIYGAGFSGGFVVKHGASSVVLNGTLQYTANYQNGIPAIPLSLGFAAVQGEWEFEVSYPTALNVTLISADIGNKNLYTILFGGYSLPQGQYNC